MKIAVVIYKDGKTVLKQAADKICFDNGMLLVIAGNELVSAHNAEEILSAILTDEISAEIAYDYLTDKAPIKE